MIRSIRRFDFVRGRSWPCVLSILASVALAASVAADQLVENYNASLISYLYIGSTSGKTLVQGVRPRFEQREANIDGTADAPPEDVTLATSAGLGRPFGFSASRGLGGDWFADGPLDAAGGVPGTRWGAIDLSLGNYSQFEVDLRLPAPGFSWTIGRCFNGRQLDSSDASFDSNGYQGLNWSQLSQPEIVFHDDADDEEDMIYLVTSAGSFVEFVRLNESSLTFKGRNGAVGAFVFTAGSDGQPDLWTYTGQHGGKMVFFGFDANAGAAKGQLWKLIDPAGNTAVVGSTSSGSAAISAGYDGSGRITTAFDTANRRYSYTYSGSAIGGAVRLTQVLCERLTSGTWASSPVTATVATVAYTYYQSGGTTYGDEGNLKQVTVTVPSSVSSVDLVRKRYYRYWTGSFSGGNPGHPNLIQYIVDAEGVRTFDWSDTAWDDDHFTASESTLKPYASAYFTYDSSRRILTTWSNGACGCSGGSGDGMHQLAYSTNGGFSNTSGYDTAWKSRTVVKFPSETANAAEGRLLTQYFDEVGQALSVALTDGDPEGDAPASGQWSTKVTRDSVGAVTEVSPADNISAYDHDTGAFTASSDAGRVFLTTRVGSGELKGFALETKHSIEGTGGDDYLDLTLTYPSDGSLQKLTVGDLTIPRALPSSFRQYTQAITSGTTGSIVTSLAYSFHSGPAANMVKARTVTNPTVTSANNGSNSATTTKTYLRADGTIAFREDENGIFSYSGYAGGQLVKSIADAQTNHGSDFLSGDDPNGDFGITESGAGLRQITTYAYDQEGRLDSVTLFANASTSAEMRVQKHAYTRLLDQRMVTLGYPDYEAGGTPVYHGPASYRVSNLANRSVFSGLIAFSGNQTTTPPGGQIDHTESDPITAVLVGTLARMQTSMFNAAGRQLDESRQYFDIPTSEPGTSGANFDATTFGYNSAGRQWRTKSADGTISRTVFDKLGRPISYWIGTNDNEAAFPGGESSGSSNMVKVQEIVYDGGSDAAPGRVTAITRLVEGSSSGSRMSESEFDESGNPVLIQTAEPPFVLRKFDHMGRVIATGLYSSASGLSASSDPTSVTTNRLALFETAYDERGRVWKSTRHEIVQSGGSAGTSTDTITSKSWFDAAGRLVKVEGEQLAKYAHDRLGRQVHEYILASVDDSSYADALTVTGDVVLEQHDTTFDPVNGQVVMTASISRHPSDYGGGSTSGALDTNADSDGLKYTMSDLKGRIQIGATWFDRYGRVTDSAFYGTNGGSDFDRDGLGVPTRSDTVLVSSSTYSTDGTVLETNDPRAQKTRFLYDDLGRTVATIGNYTNGSLTSATRDNDIYTRYTYANGHQTSMWVDIDGDGTVDTDDQVTTYTYGVVKGTAPGDSTIASGALLQKVAYPDSSGGSDVVAFAYNAQGQIIWHRDQSGNIIETSFDANGRERHRRATTIASGFDDTVERISTSYDSHGRIELITSWDTAATGSGSVLNEIKYTFDGWGNLTSFKQDPDSAVGGSGFYESSYAFAKAATAGRRQTLRRSSMTLAGKTWTLDYSSTGSLLDADASRVTNIKDGGTTVCRYWYLGEGDVVGREYSGASIKWNEWATGTPPTYPDRDQFNRITSSRWTKSTNSGPVDFVDLDVAYDRASNVVSVKDNIYPGFDVLYSNDGLNRLTDADEGTLSSGSISSRKRRQLWTLSQTGNWPTMRLDLDGNGNYTGTDELDETRTHSLANEIITRDIDSDTSVDYTLAHDAVGNLTDDGQSWKYKYDAFGRLKELRKRSDDSLLAEYTYYGNNFRASEHYDADADADVDSNDPTYFFAWDEGWRLAAVHRGSDANPKERFLHHQAGNSGYGGSSYIDSLVLRDRDANTAWTSASDGTLEEQRYYCQSWRHDVVAMVTSGGSLAERARYSAYGVAFGIPLGDVNGDGACNSTDVAAYALSPTAVRYDLNLDGVVNSADQAIASGNTGVTLGRGKLSNIGNRYGYAGYESDFVSDLLMHVRNRLYHAVLGRWTRRDPLGYVDGASLYQYVGSRPITGLDAMGLAGTGLGCQGGGGPGECPGTRGGALEVIQVTPAPPSGCMVPNPMPTPTKKQCCDAIGRDPACTNGDVGGVVCCNGKAVTCTWDLPSGPGGIIISICVEVHEHDHLDDVVCSGCPSGFVCRPPFIPGADPNAEECSAYRKEIACYNRLRGACDSHQGYTPAQKAACKALVDKWLEDACQKAAEHCGSRPGGCP